MSTLAKTGNTVRASAQLEKLSSRIPSGPEWLAPSWQGDLALYRPHSGGLILATERLILGDLDLYVARWRRGRQRSGDRARHHDIRCGRPGRQRNDDRVWRHDLHHDRSGHGS